MNASRIAVAGCGGCPISRRGFLAGCAACAGAGLALPGRAAGQPAGADAAGKAKVRLVFTTVPNNRPIWPNIGYDFEKRKKQILDVLIPGCREVAFEVAEVQNAQQAVQLLKDDEPKGFDGYLVFMLGLWTRAPQAIAAAGKPTLFVDDLYGGSGEFLIANAAARRNAKMKVACVSSSRLQDAADAARCFALLKQGKSAEEFVAAVAAVRHQATSSRDETACKEDKLPNIDIAQTIEKAKKMTLLTVGGGWGMPKIAGAAKATLGITVLPIQFPELHAAFEKADADQAETWAQTWTKAAEKIVEPKADDIRSAARMYLAMREVMKARGACGITINCLGGFYGGHIKGYPCLGFTQLNDDGLVGACEADITSSLTMMTIGAMTGRPGFISDPVIDTSKNQIIYAHCVGPTKVFGPSGPVNPAHVRSHSEDRQGACLRSLLPLGYLTTTLEIQVQRKEILLHQGKAVDNIDEDKACRTKLACEVKGDIEKLFNEWDRWGWHRVTFYGDLKAPVQEFAKAIGFTIIEEA
ncbi:MAG: hypothetical protein BWX88_00793 [Planctomycetes bacterium ADurb.Bin126]|nr:MAG: hypothetical protein BWX88_00793 [Planctomycetes bacterium ADurb.Bin126]